MTARTIAKPLKRPWLVRNPCRFLGWNSRLDFRLDWINLRGSMVRTSVERGWRGYLLDTRTKIGQFKNLFDCPSENLPFASPWSTGIIAVGMNVSYRQGYGYERL